MSGFCAFFGGVNIESVSHPKDLSGAKRYFKKRYSASTVYQLVVISVNSTPDEFKAAKELSLKPPKKEKLPKSPGSGL